MTTALSTPAKVEAPSPVIHQLATHDLLVAILAAPASRDAYLAGWAPERAIALGFGGYLRPDALAVVGSAERAVALFIERDLGTERGAILAAKARVYSAQLSNRQVPMHVGFVVESARRAAALAYPLRRYLDEYELPGHTKASCLGDYRRRADSRSVRCHLARAGRAAPRRSRDGLVCPGVGAAASGRGMPADR